MKLFKKVLSVAAVMALVVTAVPNYAKAATNVVDFENGDYTGFSALLTDGDSDQSLISIADLNGSKALFIDKQDAGKVAKVDIDVIALVGASNLDKVRAITLDVTVVNPDGAVLDAWNGGGVGAKIGPDGKVWYQGGSWEAQDAENSQKTIKVTEKFVDGMGFTKDATASGYLFMNWSGNLNDFYIDNVQFLDADGNALELNVAAADTAATDTATTDTAADTTATADVPKTGVVGLGLVYGIGAIASSAVLLKRKGR